MIWKTCWNVDGQSQISKSALTRCLKFESLGFLCSFAWSYDLAENKNMRTHATPFLWLPSLLTCSSQTYHCCSALHPWCPVVMMPLCLILCEILCEISHNLSLTSWEEEVTLHSMSVPDALETMARSMGTKTFALSSSCLVHIHSNIVTNSYSHNPRGLYGWVSTHMFVTEKEHSESKLNQRKVLGWRQHTQILFFISTHEMRNLHVCNLKT